MMIYIYTMLYTTLYTMLYIIILYNHLKLETSNFPWNWRSSHQTDGFHLLIIWFLRRKNGFHHQKGIYHGLSNWMCLKRGDGAPTYGRDSRKGWSWGFEPCCGMECQIWNPNVGVKRRLVFWCKMRSEPKHCNMASVFCGPKLEQIDQVHFSNGICLGHEPWIVSARIMTVQAGCMIHTQEKQINMVINTLRIGTTITMFFS